MISNKMSDVREAATISMNQKASDLQKRGIKVYNFGIGEPDQTTPTNIIESAFDYARSGKTHYTPSDGIPELREKIAEKMKRKNNLNVNPSNIVVTPTKYALFMTAMCILNTGEKVIIPEPYWVSYPYMVRLSGGIPKFLETEDDYEFDGDLLRKKLGESGVKALILNNPLNPSGKVYSEKTLRKLADIILEYKNIYLISDEIYEDLIYTGRMFSPASIPEMGERTVTISGFSKSYAMTGWRIGYVTGPKELMKAISMMQQHTITCAPSISQYAALAALDDSVTPVRLRNTFLERRNLVIDLLSESELLSFYKPDGTFYIFPSYDLKNDSVQFSSGLLESKHVIVTPG
ncbi:MAG: pyridoxal phosphate-dependent aminotransferase, partial [Thermoplasmatales archaeon]